MTSVDYLNVAVHHLASALRFTAESHSSNWPSAHRTFAAEAVTDLVRLFASA